MNRDIITEIFAAAGAPIDYQDGAAYLGMDEKDFRTKDWERVDYCKLLENRIRKVLPELKIQITKTTLGIGYGQGEWWSWINEFEFYLEEQNTKIRATTLVKEKDSILAWVDDNFGLYTMKVIIDE